MTRRKIAVPAILALFIFLMVWSFGSSAANNTQPATDVATPQSFFQDGEEETVDADLGKFGSPEKRERYLRARDEYVARKRGIEPGRPFNPELRGLAIERMERQEKGRLLESAVMGQPVTPPSGGGWISIGPNTIPNGQGLASPFLTAVSGRVTSVVVDPSNANNVYLGTAQGGVWRSLNAGTTWEPIFDTADSLAIGALALAPSDPSILYVGTGEFNSCGDCFFGAGLYRIDNVNTTPSLVGPINPQETVRNITYRVFNGRSITKILVHPTNPATIFVSTARGVSGSGANAIGSGPPNLAPRGLWRSTNATSSLGSITFDKVVVNLDGPNFDSPPTGNVDVVDMVMEPGNPDVILVAVIGLSSGFGGIYRTANALIAAAEPNVATPSFDHPATFGASVRTTLAINKIGSTVTVYAATSETPPTGSCTTASNSGVVRKSTDGGATWSTPLAGGRGFCGGQCFYDMPIAVNPNNADEVYLGGNARGSCSDGVKKSTDGGTTFTRDDNGLHADSHAFFYDTAGNIYAGNDGGIWKRSSSAAPATQWTNLNSSPLSTLQFYSIAVHPTDQFMMIGGTQDNGTPYQQTSSGNWSQAEGGDGGYALIDTSATNTTNVTMYHTFYNITNDQVGFDRIINTNCLPLRNSWPARGIGFLPSPDAEITSIEPCDGTPVYLHNGLSLSDNMLFYAPMALGPGAPNTLYFGTDRLYRSTDRGDHMTVVSQGPINPGGCNIASGPCPITSIGIWPGGDNIRLVGLGNGQVWATSRGSTTLVNLNFPAPANPTGTLNKFIGRVMIDPNNKNVAYVTLSYYAAAGQGIWKITNLAAAAAASPAAATWTAAGNGIPSVPINAFAIDPRNSNHLYAGTDIGVYFSNDAGASWAPFGTGLPRSAVFDLQIQPTSRILRAATHGRGIWETPLVNPGASTVQFSAGSSSVNEGQVSTTVTVTRSGDTSFPASVNYATSDGSGANSCNATTGSASSRCDYISTLGTLNFGAHEISKTISIPITGDSYVEGAETFTVSLSAAAGLSVSLGAPSAHAITINDSGFNGPNQIDGSGFFVREHYIDFLNREPDAPGLQFWTNNIEQCGGDNACREVQRINTSGAFFLSIEFKETGYLVERFYKVAHGDGTGSSTLGGTLHNLSVPIVRFNEFIADTQRIGQGVIVNQGNWQEQLENNKQAFAEEFVKRSSFLTPFPLSMTAAQFVDKLNDNARDAAGARPLSSGERDQLVADLTAGTKTRAQAVRAVAEDVDLFNSETNRAFVLMQYFGYLRRNPNDPQDTDYTGYEFWLVKLNQFNGNYVAAEMVKAFISSDEYRRRFAL